MATPKLNTPVTFEVNHRHRGIDYKQGDVGLVTETAAKKLERKKLAKAGGEKKSAKNQAQAAAVH